MWIVDTQRERENLLWMFIIGFVLVQIMRIFSTQNTRTHTHTNHYSQTHTHAPLYIWWFSIQMRYESANQTEWFILKVIYIHRYSLRFLFIHWLFSFVFLDFAFRAWKESVPTFAYNPKLNLCVVFGLIVVAVFWLHWRELRNVINNVGAYIIEKENYKYSSVLPKQRIFIAQIKWQDRLQHLSHSFTTRSLFSRMTIVHCKMRALCLSSFSSTLCAVVLHFFAAQKQILPLLFWILWLIGIVSIRFSQPPFISRLSLFLWMCSVVSRFRIRSCFCISGLRAFVCIDQHSYDCIVGTCVCWLGHDFSAHMLWRWPVHAFSWAPIRFECISTVIIVIACVFQTIRTYLSFRLLCVVCVSLKWMSLLNTFTIKQINYRSHSLFFPARTALRDVLKKSGSGENIQPHPSYCSAFQTHIKSGRVCETQT